MRYHEGPSPPLLWDVDVRDPRRKVLFWPYLKPVQFKNSVPGVVIYGVLNDDHAMDAFFGPCWGLYLANGARKSRHRIRFDDPSTMGAYVSCLCHQLPYMLRGPLLALPTPLQLQNHI